VIDTTQDPDLVVGTTIVGTNQAYGTVATGGVSNISAADVSGINDMFFATGVGNQGHIGSVGASVSELTMN
jgi:hypothetical protein